MIGEGIDYLVAAVGVVVTVIVSIGIYTYYEIERIIEKQSDE